MPRFVVYLLLAFASQLALSQVVARQGDPAGQDSLSFHSPMVLELPLFNFGKLAFNSGKNFKEVRQYVCDDALIKNLQVVKKRGPKSADGPTIALAIDALVYVLPSRDRLIQLRFEIARGSTVSARAQIQELDVEEGYNVAGKAQLVVPESEFSRLFEGDAPPILRITMSVRDNE